MTTETILAPEKIDALGSEWLGHLPDVSEQRFAEAIEQAVMQSDQVQEWKKDAERIRALAKEFDRARRGSGDSYMPIWDALCESIGSDDDGDEMLTAITAAMEQQT